VSRLLSEVEEASDEELLRSFLQEYYLKATPLPPRILLPFPLEESEFLEAYWAAKGLKAHFQVPQRGERRRLLELAQKNSQLALESELRLLERRGDHPGLKALAELLRLSQRPFRIEGFDISNLMGEAVVGSIAVFEGGKPLRAQYRRMRLKGFEAPDDYAAMEQTLYRRFTGSLAQQLPLPDLILIDGGLGQLRAAQRGLERAGLEIPAVALAKREEILILSDGHELRLPLTHPALQLLIYLRDETHRNGLLYNRKLRSAQSLKSLLDGIPGIGARKNKKRQHKKMKKQKKKQTKRKKIQK
jgi:excinuclease ABC subunit C